MSIAGNYKADLSKETDVLLRSAMATISNNRQCDCTEIGIKSSVFSKIGFANVNSVPEQDQIEKYEDKGGNISLGRIDQYIKRYSFFRLEIRKIGGQVWVGLNNGTFYCVEGGIHKRFLTLSGSIIHEGSMNLD